MDLLPPGGGRAPPARPAGARAARTRTELTTSPLYSGTGVSREGGKQATVAGNRIQGAEIWGKARSPGQNVS